MSWTWKDHNGVDRQIVTVGDLNSALCRLQDVDEGQRFMACYREETEHADINVGYVSGYNSPDTMQRILEFTGTSHPVFG